MKTLNHNAKRWQVQKCPVVSLLHQSHFSYCLSMQIFLHSRVRFSHQQPKLKHFYLFFNRCTDTLFKQKHRHYCKQLFDNSLTVVQPQSSFCCSKPVDAAYLNKVTDNFSQRKSFGFNHKKKINDAYFEAFCVVMFLFLLHCVSPCLLTKTYNGCKSAFLYVKNLVWSLHFKICFILLQT